MFISSGQRAFSYTYTRILGSFSRTLEKNQTGKLRGKDRQGTKSHGGPEAYHDFLAAVFDDVTFEANKFSGLASDLHEAKP